MAERRHCGVGIPAWMPGCPLRNACVRPSWLTGPPDQKPGRGGLKADLALAVVHPSNLWEQSLLARRPGSRPGSPGHIPIHCGSEPAREGGLVAGLSLTNVPDQLCVGLFAKVA